MIDFGPTAKLRTIEEIRAATKVHRAMKEANTEAVRHRHSLGLSQKAMAERMGVSASAWQRIEEGRSPAPCDWDISPVMAMDQSAAF